MNTPKILSIAVICLSMAFSSFSQKNKAETIKVSGECGMCKKKIEKAAKDAGASYAVWNTQTKVLTVRYNSLSTNSAKIQRKIAGVGYDTPEIKATDQAYHKLDACCQYERGSVTKNMTCCSSTCVMKDGKCADEAACREKGCCSDSEKCKAMGCCGNGMAGNAKMMNCGKDGKGKDCCNSGKSEKKNN